MSLNQGPIFGVVNGSITAGQSVEIDCAGCSNVVGTISGTWTGTIQFEVTNDVTGTVWDSVSGTDLNVLDGQIPVSTGVNGTFSFNVSGRLKFRMRKNGGTGTTVIFLGAGTGPNIISGILAYVFAKADIRDSNGSDITVGQKPMSESVPTTIASNQTDIPVNVIATALNKYAARVNVRQTSAPAAGTIVWAMTNPSASTKKIVIVSIQVVVSCEDLNPLTAPTMPRYDLLRFSGGTPTGGTALTVIKMDNSNPATAVTDVRNSQAGLTIGGGITVESAFAVVGAAGTQGASNRYSQQEPLVLAPNEGFAFGLNSAGIVGMVLTGTVIWREINA